MRELPTPTQTLDDVAIKMFWEKNLELEVQPCER